MMEESIPSLDGAFHAQENQTEERGDGNPGTHRSPRTEAEPNEGLMLQESFRQVSISGPGTPATEEILFLCSECGKGFDQRDDLTLHQRTHRGRKPNKCYVCEKSFAQSYMLTWLRRSRTEEKPYKCLECKESFGRKKAFRVHVRFHTGEEPFQCIECGKSFAMEPNFWWHLRNHSGVKPYRCIGCVQSFRYRTTFMAHQRVNCRKNYLLIDYRPSSV